MIDKLIGMMGIKPEQFQQQIAEFQKVIAHFASELREIKASNARIEAMLLAQEAQQSIVNRQGYTVPVIMSEGK